MTVTFTGHLGDDLVWGSTRTWNTWIEFHVGLTLIASSANGDFAITGGKVTEDISRSIRRDIQVDLMFPSNPRRRTVAAFSVVTTGSPFEVGTSTVGGTDVVGGAATTTEEVDVPPLVSDTARSPFIPTEIGDLLDPHSLAWMLVYAGYEGSEVLLGTFDISTTEVRAQEGGPIMSITGHSFERRLDLAGFWEMEAFDNNTPAITAAAFLIRQVFPTQKITVVSSAVAIGELTWKPGDNRLTKINDLLAVDALEGWFDRNNDFTIVKSPTSTDFGFQPPRWDIIDGHNARVATLNGATRKFSDQDSFNGVVVEGTSQSSPQSAPVFAALWNRNPTSPLYFDPDFPGGSGMGPRPKMIRSELAKTTADCQSVATVELGKVLMVTDSVDATVPANANLEMGQFARFVCDGLGADGVYRINRVVHDLAGAPAEVTLYRFSAV